MVTDAIGRLWVVTTVTDATGGLWVVIMVTDATGVNYGDWGPR